jgi:hypothetical protein
MTRPTLTVRDGFDDYPIEMKVLALSEGNTAEELRSAVDGTIGCTGDNSTTVTKEWLATCLLALGGPAAAPVDVEVGGVDQ